jgi:predicted dehydrogenase
MNLTAEQQAAGRRNFLKALAGTPAVAALGLTSYLRGPLPGGPVRIGLIGLGGQGRAQLAAAASLPQFVDIRAICDINPAQFAAADKAIADNKLPAARHYADWRELIQKEDVEAVLMAPPLWAHADLAVGCMDAGKHVLCEKMMAWDPESCERMIAASHKNNRVLEIGYQRFYSPLYQAAYEGLVKPGLLGDIYHVRLAWHRNGNWRRQGKPPSADFDASQWGYPTFEHLLNWRLYRKYSRGLFAELGSHQLSVTNWFLGSAPTHVTASGGVFRFKDGRESCDHVYGTFEYPDGRTAVFSSVESNAFDNYYEMFLGTKGTLILSAETEAMFFEEGSSGARTTVEVTSGRGPALESTETQPGNRPGAATGTATTPERFDRRTSTRLEVQAFAAAIRSRRPLNCGPEAAMKSARACIQADESVFRQARLTV